MLLNIVPVDLIVVDLNVDGEQSEWYPAYHIEVMLIAPDELQAPPEVFESIELLV